LNGNRFNWVHARNIAGVSIQPPGRRAPTMLRLGRFRGVPVLIAPSWAVIGLLLTLIYGPLVDQTVDGISAPSAYLAAFGFSLVFGMCVLAHELGHTTISLALGHPVRRVVLFLLGGVSEIEGEPERARDELLIAIAGPAVSAAIAAGAWLGFRATPDGSLAHVLLALLFWSNLVVAVFNLLPGLPLDGGRLVRAAAWALGAKPQTATKVAAWCGRVVAVLVGLSGFAVRDGGLGASATVLSAVMGVYLWAGATQALRFADLFSRLHDVTVTGLLRKGVMLPADVSVAEALRRAWEGQARGVVLVDAADRPSAIVEEARMGAVPPERRPWMQAAEVARPLEPGLILPLELGGRALLNRMRETPAHEYLVVDDAGAPAGIVSTVDFARQLQGKPA
jgi:Zn-dependent protease/CBS domain-containing protein